MHQEVTKNKPKKPRLELRGIRISAGYNKYDDFVTAINQYLEENDVKYRITKSAYIWCETGGATAISFNMAYYVSRFLKCPIEVFADKKI